LVHVPKLTLTSACKKPLRSRFRRGFLVSEEVKRCKTSGGCFLVEQTTQVEYAQCRHHYVDDYVGHRQQEDNV